MTNSQTQLCSEKKIMDIHSYEIIGKIILGVLTIRELSILTGHEN